ncbi:YicC family protein [Xanthobacter dioxanivorans]|uniref:YicC family protein n=1 Tax=Xanthobacter dioxanivorans TaxID=2528964 RepID=A0A974PKE3_9HYPH|nr:YicC/YloC family endoribonuclease [Xanthobacter dioxanivorans]QRG04816.1 YicC family protein [Xanthobacter dioxanivorans]
MKRASVTTAGRHLAAAPLASMTGFSRVAGSHGAWRFGWEVRAVNGKGLDLRLRLPPGFEALEADVRAHTGQALSRGSVSATLSATREGEASTVRVNQSALEALFRAVSDSARRLGAPAPTLDALLAVKGMVEIAEAEESEDERRALIGAVLSAFDQALAELGAMRAREGRALHGVLSERLDAIASLVFRAERLPERSPEQVKARIADQVRVLMEAANLDPDRLHQEAVLAVTKADVREELDRLAAHLSAARDLLAVGGPVGRKLDFLAQEFNREANTLCSKSNSVALTQIGLDLKLLVDQFREQIQNLE